MSLITGPFNMTLKILKDVVCFGEEFIKNEIVRDIPDFLVWYLISHELAIPIKEEYENKMCSIQENKS